MENGNNPFWPGYTPVCGRRFGLVQYITLHYMHVIKRKHVFKDFLKNLKHSVQNFKEIVKKCFIGTGSGI